MTPAGEILRDRIAREGAIRFSQFMQVALYEPGAGYYSGPRDPFGREGDFYTAAQIQPVFGRLVAGVLTSMAPVRVLDWGGGRGEMKESLSTIAGYLLVGPGSAEPEPERRTAIFANELFDALPVDAARRDERGVWQELRVAFEGERFVWSMESALEGAWLEYALDAAAHLPESGEILIELPVGYEETVAAMTRAAPEGTMLVIDYGYTAREILRFPQGSLMSYRRHRASGDVLSDPGERDITAHVPWAWLEAVALRNGWRRRSFESLAAFLLRAGEPDGFEAALAGAPEQHRLQLKTLLFGMGESFQTMMLGREGEAH